MVAKRLGIEYFDGSFGKLAAELGYDAVSDLSAEKRIEMQEKVLALHIAKITALPRPCVTDRTPLDYLAYAIADVSMHSGITTAISRRIWAYVENCLEATRAHYGAVLLFKPLPTYVEEDGKPGPCIAYQTHIQLLIEGAASRVQGDLTTGRMLSFDLNERDAFASSFFSKVVLALESQHFDAITH